VTSVIRVFLLRHENVAGIAFKKRKMNLFLPQPSSYIKCNKELNINPHLKFSADGQSPHTDGYSKVGEMNPNSTRTDILILKSVKRILIPIRLQSRNHNLFQLYQFHQFTYKYCIFPNFAHDDITPVLIS
jgi:hypothetical protein